MIVKNEEKYLHDCLISVKDVADEIVIVDTGSIDNTIKIAEEFRAKIFNFNWVNDFSVARNYALAQCTGNWIFYLDADERLDKSSIAELREIIKENERAAYYCSVKSYDSGESRDNSLRYPRLFFNTPEIRFEGKVHEQIEPSLIQNKYRIANSNVLIHHLGYDIPKEEQQKKALRNLKLLKEQYEQNQSAYDAFQIAQSYNVLGDIDNARQYFLIASENNKLHFSLRAQSYTSLALIAHLNNSAIDAENYIQTSIKLDNSQPYTYLLASKIALRRGSLKDAEERCKKAFQLNEKSLQLNEQSNLFVSLDPEEAIYYGLTLALQSQNRNNMNFYQKALAAFYSKKKNGIGIEKLAVMQKLFTCSLLNEKEELLFVKMCNKNTLNLLLILLSNNSNKQMALNLANKLFLKLPDNIDIQKAIAKLNEELGRIDEAIQLMEKLLEEEKYDAAVLFYLISFYLKIGTVEKIKPVIALLEKTYYNIPEVIARITTMKEKLLALKMI